MHHITARPTAAVRRSIHAARVASRAGRDIRGARRWPLLGLEDLDGYFPFTPPKSRAEWDTRAAFVRRRILVSQGLWPMPMKTPLPCAVDSVTVAR